VYQVAFPLYPRFSRVISAWLSNRAGAAEEREAAATRERMVVERVNFILRIVLEALLEESKVAADEWKSMREIYRWFRRIEMEERRSVNVWSIVNWIQSKLEYLITHSTKAR